MPPKSHHHTQPVNANKQKRLSNIDGCKHEANG